METSFGRGIWVESLPLEWELELLRSSIGAWSHRYDSEHELAITKPHAILEKHLLLSLLLNLGSNHLRKERAAWLGRGTLFRKHSPGDGPETHFASSGSSLPCFSYGPPPLTLTWIRAPGATSFRYSSPCLFPLVIIFARMPLGER